MAWLKVSASVLLYSTSNELQRWRERSTLTTHGVELQDFVVDLQLLGEQALQLCEQAQVAAKASVLQDKEAVPSSQYL